MQLAFHFLHSPGDTLLILLGIGLLVLVVLVAGLAVWAGKRGK
jgi:hypothetical protein